MESRKDKTRICGTKPSTAPTPASIPSMIRPYSQPLTWRAERIVSKSQGIHSPNKTSLAQLVPIVPIENGKFPIAIAYIKNMMTTKIGIARIRLVTIRSMRSERLILCFPAFFFFTAR